MNYKAIDSKDKKLSVTGTITITLMDALEKEIKPMDKRKFVAWTVDHQPYHILMEDAIEDYIKIVICSANHSKRSVFANFQR